MEWNRSIGTLGDILVHQKYGSQLKVGPEKKFSLGESLARNLIAVGMIPHFALLVRILAPASFSAPGATVSGLQRNTGDVSPRLQEVR